MAQLKYKLNGEWVPLNLGGGGGGEQYELPVATQDTLGGVSIGEGIDITPEGKISVKTPSSPAESVLYTAQELTEEQKAQARQNIGSFDIFDLPNLIKFDVKSKASFGDKIVEGQVFALNDFQPIDINTTDTETVEAWRTLYHTFSIINMQTLLGNTDMYIALAFLIDKNMFGENFYSNHIYSNCAWFGRNHKFMKFYSWAENDPTQKVLAGFIYDLEKSVGSFKYNVLTNTIEYFSYSYPLTASANTSTDGKKMIGQINMSADPANDMEIATKHYVDNAPIKKASATELGGIKVGTGLAIADDGTLSSNGTERIKYNFHSATITDEDKVVLKEIIKNPVGDFTFDSFQVIDIQNTGSVIMFGVIKAIYNRVDYYGVSYTPDITGNAWQSLRSLYLSENPVAGEILTADNFNNYFDQNFGWRITSSSSEVYNAKELCLFYSRTDGENTLGTAYYNFRADDRIHNGNLSDYISEKFVLFYSPNSQTDVFWQYNGNDFELSTSAVSIERILYKD